MDFSSLNSYYIMARTPAIAESLIATSKIRPKDVNACLLSVHQRDILAILRSDRRLDHDEAYRAGG